MYRNFFTIKPDTTKPELKNRQQLWWVGVGEKLRSWLVERGDNI
jgi:hypothetical protein